VNHRFLDVQLRMPSGLDALEDGTAQGSQRRAVRGHVDLTLSVDRNYAAEGRLQPRTRGELRGRLQRARDEFGLKGEPDLNAILRLPGALQSDNRGDDDLTPWPKACVGRLARCSSS
jgi:uncharacterized protein YicC (UPF0701 family)